MTRLATLALALAALLAAAPAAQAAPPTITETSFSAVTTTSATLEAQVNPGGKATLYRFEYGTADCETSECTKVPDPNSDAPIGNGTAPVGVSAEVSGLTPDTTYHFRAVARNGDAPAGIEGPDTTFTTFALPQTFGPCPNEEFRTGPSARLPDCRAYEQASPLDKNGADVAGGGEVGRSTVRASIHGDRITFFTTAGLPGGVGGQDFPLYMASRGPEGWSTQGLLPPPGFGTAALVNGWAPDLSQTFAVATKNTDEASFLSRSADGTISTIFPHTPGASARMVGTSADGNLVYFQSDAVLAPGAIAGVENLYLWQRESGEISLAGLLPDSACGSPRCVPADGAFAGSYHWWQEKLEVSASEANYYLQDQHAVSDDGRRLYFTEGASGRLFLRESQTAPDATTVQVNASQRTDCAGDPTCGADNDPDPEPDPLGARPAQFQMATPDGSHAFFTSAEELTDDANTGPDQPTPTIAQAEINGDTDSIDPAFLPAAAAGIALDESHIYWADPANDRIGRAEIDGDNPDPDFITGADNPQYVTVEGEYVYWTNAADEEPGTGSIGRAEIGATEILEVNQEFIPGVIDEDEPTEEVLVDNPRGIDVDGEFIYWTNMSTLFGNHTIARSDTDGTVVNPNFINTGSDQAQGIAVNDSHIYWAGYNESGNNNFVVRRDLDGDLDTQKFISSGQNTVVQGLALDSEFVYWVLRSTETIGRMELGDFDLPAVEQDPELEWIQSDGIMKGLAVSPAQIFWSLNGETPPNPGSDLYRYDAATDDLTDVTPHPDKPNGADVQGVIGTSSDGSHVYFAANGDLDGAGDAGPGDCGINPAGTPVGACNIYLSHGDEIRFVARIDVADDGLDFGGVANWKPLFGADIDRVAGFEDRTGRVSPDGSAVLFLTRTRLSSYDNQGQAMLYRYSATEDGLTCVSCNPTEAPPSEDVSLARVLPTGQVSPDSGAPTLTRNLSADGNRVVFETADKLVGGDTNGDTACPQVGITGSVTHPICLDVYMWEAEGSGTCQTDPGCLYLISTGTSPFPSYFADASADGDQIFFFTRDQLVPQDEDQIRDIYVASVESGLASQHAPPPQICLSGEECRSSGPNLPPPPGGAGSAVFEGPGNGAGEGGDPSACRRFSKKAQNKLRAAGKAENKRARKLRRQAKGLKRQAKSCRQRAAA